MWRKTDNITAKYMRLMHVLTNTASVTLTLCVRCIASVDANLRHAAAPGLSCKRRSQGVKKTRDKNQFFPTANLSHSTTFKKARRHYDVRSPGRCAWLDSIPATYPVEIPVPNAASRSRSPIGSRAVPAARRSSGSAVPAIIALKRSRSMKRRIRTRSPPDRR